MSNETYKPGFKLVPHDGMLTVAHGHGHYHSNTMKSLNDLDKLVAVLKSTKSDEEKAEIDKQLEDFLSAIEKSRDNNLLHGFSDELKARIKSIT